LSFYSISLSCVIAYYRIAFGLRILGREHIPQNGPIILASNHISNFDAPALACALAPRHLSFFAKAELFRFKPFGRLISKLNAFPVDRSRGDIAAMRRSLAILKEGRALLLFPEGGRNIDGSAEAKNGVAFLARLSRVPVIPAYVDGTEKTTFRHTITIAFGPAMHYERSLGQTTEVMSDWSNELMGRIHALRDTCRKR
jgi:1-acyl-sn-glycerol-3-phosphate acyltransferase